MAAVIRINIEPAKTTTVQNVVTIKSEADKVLLTKYLLTSYQGPGTSRLDKKMA